jgi:hypothetical protein
MRDMERAGGVGVCGCGADEETAHGFACYRCPRVLADCPSMLIRSSVKERVDAKLCKCEAVH